jgi:hypothetical protein
VVVAAEAAAGAAVVAPTTGPRCRRPELRAPAVGPAPAALHHSTWFAKLILQL